MRRLLSPIALSAVLGLGIATAPASAHKLPVAKGKRAILKQAKHDAEVTNSDSYGVSDCKRVSRHSIRCLAYTHD